MEKIFYEEISKPPLNEETLSHWGIKGMKWGKRKGKTKTKNKHNSATFRKKKKGYWDGYKWVDGEDAPSRTKTPTIYKYKKVAPMPEFKSAMYGDPRYERKTDAMIGDWKMKGPGAMTGDPRYERKTDALTAQGNDQRFWGQKKKKRW